MKHRRKRIARRRRQDNKTDYKKRLNLLKSGKPRLIVRITNKRVIAQLATYDSDGDRIVTTADSRELEDLGWDASMKNTSAAYLTGLLIAKKAKEEGIEDAVLDIGLHTPVKGARVFAVAKGANDGGLGVPVSDDIVPDEDRIRGEHLQEDASGQFDDVVSKIEG